MADMKYGIKIGAIDKFSKPLVGMAKSLGGFIKKSKGFDTMSQDADNFRKKLGGIAAPLRKLNNSLQTLSKNTGLSKLGKDAGALGRRLGGVAGGVAAIGGGAFLDMSSMTKDISQQQKLANAVGMSAKELRAWGAIAKTAGLDSEHVVDMAEELNNKLGESAGVKEMAAVTDALAMLGTTREALEGMSTGEQFAFLTDLSSKHENKQIAMSAMDMLVSGEASKLMGLIWEERKATGKGGAEQNADNQKRDLLTDDGVNGSVLFTEENARLSALLLSGTKELVGIVAGKLAPLLESFGKDFIANFGNIKNQVVEFAKNLPAYLEKMKTAFQNVWGVTKAFFGFFGRVVKFLGVGKTAFLGLAFVIGVPLLTALSSLFLVFTVMGKVALFNPLTYIILGIVAGIFLLIKVVGKIKKFLASFSLSEVGGKIVDSLWVGMSTVLSNLVKWFGDKMDELLQNLPDFMKEQLGIKIESKGAMHRGSLNRDVRPSAITPQAKNEFGGNVQVEFKNAPPNTRVLNTSSSSDKVSINVDTGLNMSAFI